MFSRKRSADKENPPEGTLPSRGFPLSTHIVLFSGVHSYTVSFGVDEYPDISDIVVEEGFVEDHLAPVGFDAGQDRCHIGGGIEVDESAGMTGFGLRPLANGTGRTGGGRVNRLGRISLIWCMGPP